MENERRISWSQFLNNLHQNIVDQTIATFLKTTCQLERSCIFDGALNLNENTVISKFVA